MHFKKMKKSIGLLLAIVFLVGLLAVPAGAATTYNYTIKVNGDQVIKFQSDKRLSYSEILSKVKSYLYNQYFGQGDDSDESTEPQKKQEPVEQPQPQPQPQPEQKPAGDNGGSELNGLTFAEKQMFDSVNKERTSRGLQPLKIDMDLVKLARMKSQDMINKNYFSHTSPTYGSPFEMMRNYGITYRMAGENLAGAPTVELAHENLMNSPGHRANILRPEFTHVGIGIIDGGRYGKMFTQMFIQK